MPDLLRYALPMPIPTPDRPLASRWAHLGIALLAFSAATLAFYPADQPWLGWFALAPWIAWREARGPRGDWFAIPIAVFVQHMAMLAWVAEIHWAAIPVIALFGIPSSLALVVLLRLFGRARVHPLWAYPLALVASEMLLEFYLDLSWTGQGYAQWRWTQALQSAAWFRGHALGALVITVQTLVALLALRLLRSPAAGSTRGLVRGGGAALAIALALQVTGALALQAPLRPEEEWPLAVGLQPNIALSVGRRVDRIEGLRRHFELLEDSGIERDSIDHFVTTETVLPSIFEPSEASQVPNMLRTPVPGGAPGRVVGDLLPRGRGQLSIVGLLEYKPEQRPFALAEGRQYRDRNLALVLRDGRDELGRYAKRILVPLGEWIPGRNWLPGYEALRAAVRDMAGAVPDMRAGEEPLLVPFGARATGTGDPAVSSAEAKRPEVLIAPTICYEIVFPWVFAEAAREGADLIVNVSNDAWFGESAALDLVDVATRFRAVEAGRPIVRVSNTGISVIVDAQGRSVDQVQASDGDRKAVAGVLAGRVPLLLDPGVPPAARFGLLPALAAWLSGWIAAMAFGRERALS